MAQWIPTLVLLVKSSPSPQPPLPRISLTSPGWLGTQWVDQAGCEITKIYLYLLSTSLKIYLNLFFFMYIMSYMIKKIQRKRINLVKLTSLRLGVTMCHVTDGNRGHWTLTMDRDRQMANVNNWIFRKQANGGVLHLHVRSHCPFHGVGRRTGFLVC